MKVSYIITFRDDQRRRSANLSTVLDWLSWFQDIEVIVVEQDAVSAFQGNKLPPNCKTLFVPYDGAFNKSWGLNLGYRHSVGDVLAFGDSDIIMNREVLASCFDACFRPYDAVNPYDRVVDLTDAESQVMMKGDYDPDVTRRVEDMNRVDTGEFPCFCGGIFLIKRKIYEAIGGFDERFLGWGGEDDAMTHKLLALSNNVKTMPNQRAFHLWHERNPATLYGHAHYQDNLKLIAEYRSYEKADLLRLCERQAKSMGRIDKYATGESKSQ